MIPSNPLQHTANSRRTKTKTRGSSAISIFSLLVGVTILSFLTSFGSYHLITKKEKESASSINAPHNHALQKHLGEFVIEDKHDVTDTIKAVDNTADYYINDKIDENLLWVGNTASDVPNVFEKISHLVISHCDASKSTLKFMSKYVTNVPVERITMYNKCGTRELDAANYFDVDAQEIQQISRKVGGHAHSYVHWMATSNFVTAADNDNAPDEDGVVLFMHDDYNTIDFYLWKIADLLRIATANGFACAETVYHRHGNKAMGHLSRSIYHDYKVWANARYEVPATADKNNYKSEFESVLYYAASIQAHFPAPLLPVCYGNLFASTLSSIRRVDAAVWSNIEHSLERGTNIEENIFVERMFAALLSKRLSSEGNLKISMKRRVTKCDDEYANYCGVQAVRDNAENIVGDPNQLEIPQSSLLQDLSIVESTSSEALWLGTVTVSEETDANSNLNAGSLMSKGATVSLVIWHCDKPLTWVKKYIAGYESKVKDVTIYSRCGNPVEDVPDGANVEMVPIDFGQQYAYVHWLANQKSVANEEGIVLFVHDNPHTSTDWQWWSFDSVLSTAKRNGFGCAESFEPVYRGEGEATVASNSYYHNVNNWSEYFQPEYFDELQVGHASIYNKMQEWLDDPALRLALKPNQFVPVCYGDVFAVAKDRIEEHSALWKVLEDRLKGENGVEESHFVSRLWALLLTKPLSQSGVDKLVSLKTSHHSSRPVFFPPRPGVLSYGVQGHDDNRSETKYLEPLVGYSGIIDKPYIDVHIRALRAKVVDNLEDEHKASAVWYGDSIWGDVENLGSISLVVSHCDQSLEWIRDSMFQNNDVPIADIFIYSTCGVPVHGAPDGAKIIIANDDADKNEKLGGPSHIFARWISTQKTIVNKENKDDVVFFLHDSPHRARDFLYWTFDDMLRIVSANGFVCAESVLEIVVGNARKVPISTSIYHDNEILASYAPGKYESFNPSFKSADYNDLYEWTTTMGMHEFAEHPYLPVCYGGMFAATKSQLFRNKAVAIVQEMEKRLRRGAVIDLHNDADLEETYFAERTWAALLQKPLGYNAKMVVHKKKRNVICIDSRCGVLMFKYKHFPYPHNLHPLTLHHSAVGMPYVNEKNVTALWTGDVTNGDPGDLGKFEIVVSHCDKPLHWLQVFVQGHSIDSITIYSKCGNPVEGAPTGSKIITLPNIGRCDHTYASWMAQMPPVSTDIGNDTRYDVVLFIKDNDHRSQLWDLWSIEDMFRITSSNGFACAESVLPAPGEIGFEGVSISIYHNVTRWREFTNGGYAREENRDSIHDFKSRYKNLGAWADELELPVPYPFVPVCYGGIFMTTKNQIAKKSKAMWKSLEKSLSREDNIEEGHFAERSWSMLLSKPLYPDRRKLLYERNGLVRCIGYFKGRCGVLSIKPARLSIILEEQGS